MKAWRDDEASAIGLEKIAGKEKALFETMELLQEFASDDEGAEEPRRVNVASETSRQKALAVIFFYFHLVGAQTPGHTGVARVLRGSE